MTLNLEVRDSLFKDVKALSQTIKDKDRLESERLGCNPRTALTYSFKNAVYRKTALIDNQVAAMWGVVGSLTSDTGNIYLVTGTKTEDISPIRFARIYKKETERMLEIFPTLQGIVDLKYGESLRILKLSGFTVNKPIEINNNLFCKFSISV